MSSGSVLPTLRATVFAAVCLGLGAGAHEAMSGAAIPVWALVIGGVGAYVPARFATGRGERGLYAISVLMFSLQVVFHLLFCYAQNVANATNAASMPGMSMPGGMRMPAGTSMPGTVGAAASAPMHMSTDMLLGHALAALACAWWLRRGEAAVHAVIRRVVVGLREVWVVVVLAAPPADHTPGSARIGVRPRSLRSQWDGAARPQRGPPHLRTCL
jgi:hypothetical protein